MGTRQKRFTAFPRGSGSNQPGATAPFGPDPGGLCGYARGRVKAVQRLGWGLVIALKQERYDII